VTFKESACNYPSGSVPDFLKLADSKRSRKKIGINRVELVNLGQGGGSRKKGESPEQKCAYTSPFRFKRPKRRSKRGRPVRSWERA